MRQLRFVGVTEDGTHLLLRPDTDEGGTGEPATAANGAIPATEGGADDFLLPVDERLRAASRGDRSRLGQIEIQLESSLRPREIQARVRSGESPEDVAAAAGVSLERILRFAHPVLQEREQVVIEARRTRVRRSDTAPRLGDQIDERLARQGVEQNSIVWDAYRREDGTWWLTLQWTASGRERRKAQWAFDLAARVTTPADDSAAEMQAEAPRRRPMQRVPFLPDPPAERPAASRSTLAPQPPAQPSEPSPTPTLHERPAEVPRPNAAAGSIRPSSPGVVRPPADRAASPQPGRIRQRRVGAAADPELPGIAATDDSDGPGELPADRPAAPEPAGPQHEPGENPADQPAVPAGPGPHPGPEDLPGDRPAADPSDATDAAPSGTPDPPARRAPARATKSKRRSRKAAVPSWDDIVFGSKSSGPDD
ncbi:MAG: septation protein SepH [Mycobacteriales bacterium]